MLFYLNALLIFTLDQSLKYLVHKTMFLGQSIPLLNNIVKLTYVRNTGAAFSLLVGFSPYLTIVGILVAITVIYFHYQAPEKNWVLQFGLSCLLGGSLGNLADRLIRSYVVDYIDLSVWPVFNFADIMINLGVFCLFISFLKGGNHAPHHS